MGKMVGLRFGLDADDDNFEHGLATGRDGWIGRRNALTVFTASENLSLDRMVEETGLGSNFLRSRRSSFKTPQIRLA